LSDVEVIGSDDARLRRAAELALASAGLRGHLAIELVDADRIAALNREHRGRDAPTDVLSFPVDEDRPVGAAPRELGDVVICPEYTADVPAAVIHGVLRARCWRSSTSCARGCESGLRRTGRAAQRGQVNPGQRPRGPEGRHRLRQATDHAAGDPGGGHRA
jgi:probable rRNA maturation factor